LCHSHFIESVKETEIDNWYKIHVVELILVFRILECQEFFKKVKKEKYVYFLYAWLCCANLVSSLFCFGTNTMNCWIIFI
jgi:hypothetical protein